MSRADTAQERAPRPRNGDTAGRRELGRHARRPTAPALLGELRDGNLDLPLPGDGDTWRRWESLIRLGRQDLSLARLAEGHTDAAAILAELGGNPPAWPEIWGVWAAHPPTHRLSARPYGADWVLNGSKPFCSGARTCTHALVTADLESGGRRLFAIGNKGTTADPTTWAAEGMSDSDTLTLTFTDVPAVAVGEPGDYTDRPGFHHGGGGVAACWYGGAEAVAEALADRAGGRSPDPHTLAHYGAVVRDLRAARDVLRRAAEEIDDDPDNLGGAAAERALVVRSAVVSTCTSVLDHCGEALGAGPLASDPDHTRAVQDLSVYIRQHHGARDLAQLGELTAQHSRKAQDGPGTT